MKRHLTILIVDDNVDDREYYGRLLRHDRKTFWNIVEAECYKDAIRIFNTLEVDVVLLDYSLPGYDGLYVLAKLKEVRPNLAAVMLTGQGNEVIATEAMKNGALDYVMKGQINKTGLHRVLNNAIERAMMLDKIAEQREALERYAQILAHDLKSPIGNILRLTELILGAIQQEHYQEIESYYEYIRKTATSVFQLINTLSEYNKLEINDIPFQSVSAHVIVDKALVNLYSIIQQSNAIITIEDTLPQLMCNEPQLVQLFQNLISNSIKYCKQESPKVHIGADRLHGAWRFFIKDNGIGVPEEHQKSIFEMFTRLHGQGDGFDGSGIGLATCRKIIDRHEGQIWCESKPDKGTTFFFTIPEQIEKEAEKEHHLKIV